MTRDMRMGGGALLLCGLSVLSCYGTPTGRPAGVGGGAAGNGAAGSAGASSGSGKGGEGGLAGKAAGSAGSFENGPGGQAGAGGRVMDARGGSGGAGASGGSTGNGFGGQATSGGSGGTNAGATGGSLGAAGIGAAGSGAGGSAPGCVPACASTQTCIGAKCLSNDGLPCTLAGQCATNVCTPFYVDADGDGYGAGAAVGFCGTSTPVGYAPQAGDCCDDSGLTIAKAIHPGAGFQTTSANGACGVTWDYDCSSVVETSNSKGTCAANSVFPDNCIDVPGNYPPTSCGTTQPSAILCRAHETSCQPYPSPSTVVLGCK
jgi:hypothetical protein